MREEGGIKQYQDLVRLHNVASAAAVPFLVSQADRTVEFRVNFCSDCRCA